MVLLTVEGDQVPFIPLFDWEGSTGAACPLHKTEFIENVGVVEAFTKSVIESVIIVPQLLVADKVTAIVPTAVIGTVKVVAKVLGELKVP